MLFRLLVFFLCLFLFRNVYNRAFSEHEKSDNLKAQEMRIKNQNQLITHFQQTSETKFHQLFLKKNVGEGIRSLDPLIHITPWNLNLIHFEYSQGKEISFDKAQNLVILPIHFSFEVLHDNTFFQFLEHMKNDFPGGVKVVSFSLYKRQCSKDVCLISVKLDVDVLYKKRDNL